MYFLIFLFSYYTLFVLSFYFFFDFFFFSPFFFFVFSSYTDNTISWNECNLHISLMVKGSVTIKSKQSLFTITGFLLAMMLFTSSMPYTKLSLDTGIVSDRKS